MKNRRSPGEIAPLLVALAALTAAGCSKKAAECDAVVSTINPQVEKQQKLSKKEIETVEDVVAITGELAKIADETADKLSKVTLTTPELQAFSRDYQKMEKDFAAAAKAASGGIKADAPDVEAKLKAFDAQVDAAAKKESELIAGVNKFCGN